MKPYCRIFFSAAVCAMILVQNAVCSAAELIEKMAEPGASVREITVKLSDSVSIRLNQLPAGSIAVFENRKPLPNEKTDAEGRIIHTFASGALAAGVYEVTQAQWQAVMGTTQEKLKDDFSSGAKLYGTGENMPVYYVSLKNAQKFCDRLNQLVFKGKGKREFAIPTTAEWEYACRAGTTTQLNSGKDMMWTSTHERRTPRSNELNEVGWYRGNAKGVSAVGQKKPNAWGLYDMHGNVDELTCDWIDVAFPGLELCTRMGGSWHSSPGACTSGGTAVQTTPLAGEISRRFLPTAVFREPIDKTTANFSTGFRIVLRPKASRNEPKKVYEEKPLHVNKILGLAMLMCFFDDPESAIISKESMEDFFNKLDYNGYGNKWSLAGYFFNQSRGRCLLQFDVVGYTFAQDERKHYQQGERFKGGERLIREAVTWLDKNKDYDKYSHDAEGYLRAFTTMYSRNSTFDGLWPCQMWLWGNEQVWLPGGRIHANSCILCGIGEKPQVSVLVHEAMHQVFGFDDYVDYGDKSTKTPKNQQKASQGLGNHCIMGRGMYEPGTNKQTNPTSMCGVFRYRLGWLPAMPLPANGKVRIPANGNYGYIWRNPANPYEYFLLENRNSGSAADNVLPSQGLAIWHVDDAEKDDSENEEMTEQKHFEISLEQAHGKFLLESTDARNHSGGTKDDYFFPPKYTKFGNSTTPDSKWWDGSDSGLEITNIERDGKDLILTVGKPGMSAK